MWWFCVELFDRLPRIPESNYIFLNNLRTGSLVSAGAAVERLGSMGSSKCIASSDPANWWAGGWKKFGKLKKH
jgi:hypothetical protein